MAIMKLCCPWLYSSLCWSIIFIVFSHTALLCPSSFCRKTNYRLLLCKANSPAPSGCAHREEEKLDQGWAGGPGAVLQRPHRTYAHTVCGHGVLLTALVKAALGSYSLLGTPTSIEHSPGREGGAAHWTAQMLPTLLYSFPFAAFQRVQRASKFSLKRGAAEAIPRQRAARNSEGCMFQKARKKKMSF